MACRKEAGSSAHRPDDQLRAGQEVGRVSAGLHDYSSSIDELTERRPTRQVRAEGSQVMTFSRSMHDVPETDRSAWHFRMNESSAGRPRRPDARKRTESIPSFVNCSISVTMWSSTCPFHRTRVTPSPLGIALSGRRFSLMCTPPTASPLKIGRCVRGEPSSRVNVS